MRVYNLLVFHGTSGTWYPRVTDVSGTFPALTVEIEHSSDGLHWAATKNTEIPPNTGRHTPPSSDSSSR